MTISFLNYPPVHQVATGKTLYEDAVNHCKTYKNFLFKDSRTTSVHEVHHGIHSEIRNAAGGKVNALYFGNDKAIVLPEPKCRKSDAIPFVPKELRKSRYSLYVAGQREWDDSPLYLWDEWRAYISNGEAAMQFVRDGSYNEGQTDQCVGAIEFVAYGTAILMAVLKKTGSIDKLTSEIGAYLLKTAFNVYFDGGKQFPFEVQDEIYQTLKTGLVAADLRSFMKEKLQFEVPSGIIPLDEPDFGVI